MVGTPSAQSGARLLHGGCTPSVQSVCRSLMVGEGLRVNVDNPGKVGGGREDLYIPSGYLWPSYYPVVYGLARHPGYTHHPAVPGAVSASAPGHAEVGGDGP